MKTDRIGMLATVVLAFSALAAPVSTGQAGIREDMRTLQAEMLAGQSGLRAEMRAGRAGLREDPAVFGTRLAVVGHRTDTMESRLEASERPEPEPCEGAECPGS